LLEGVVLSPQHGFAYVMRPGGGLAAVNLASGKIQWSTDKAAKPLAVAGDRLIAQTESQGGTLQLVALDPRNGAVRNSVRISLPEGVVASVVDSPAGAFRVRAESVSTDLVVRWESAGGGPVQGYLPAENEGAAPLDAPVLIAGEAVLDAGSLAVKAEPAVRVASSAALSRASLEELSAPAVKAGGRQILSADGRHVLVTEPVDAADFTLYRHRWTLYERSSGARLGSVPAMVSASPFVVVGSTVYRVDPAHAVRKDGKFVENPATLHAVNLKTGADMWKMAVRETVFRGPFAP
jgi:outer membrane protein assembly factor BamB